MKNHCNILLGLGLFAQEASLGGCEDCRRRSNIGYNHQSKKLTCSCSIRLCTLIDTLDFSGFLSWLLVFFFVPILLTPSKILLLTKDSSASVNKITSHSPAGCLRLPVEWFVYILVFLVVSSSLVSLIKQIRMLSPFCTLFILLPLLASSFSSLLLTRLFDLHISLYSTDSDLLYFVSLFFAKPYTIERVSQPLSVSLYFGR